MFLTAYRSASQPTITIYSTMPRSMQQRSRGRRDPPSHPATYDPRRTARRRHLVRRDRRGALRLPRQSQAAAPSEWPSHQRRRRGRGSPTQNAVVVDALAGRSSHTLSAIRTRMMKRCLMALPSGSTWAATTKRLATTSASAAMAARIEAKGRRSGAGPSSRHRLGQRGMVTTVMPWMAATGVIECGGFLGGRFTTCSCLLGAAACLHGGVKTVQGGIVFVICDVIYLSVVPCLAMKKVTLTTGLWCSSVVGELLQTRAFIR